MGYDAFAPISPAWINVQIVPAGRVRASRFDAFVAKLQEHRVVDLSGENDSGQNGSHPHGKVVYDFSAAQDGRASVDTFPFDLNRLPQAVVALADGHELSTQNAHDTASDEEEPYQKLLLDFERHSRSMPTHFLLIFDPPSQIGTERDHVFVVSTTDDVDGSVRDALSRLTEMFLTDFRGQVHHLETQMIDSPRLAVRSRKGTPETEPRPGSSNQSSRPTPLNRPSVVVSDLSASSETQTTSSKIRYQIVLGAFYLQAGRWVEALRELSDGATAARSRSDYLWHGKGLEYLLVCMLMLGWAGVEFDIPQVCRPTVEKGLFSRSAEVTPGTNSPVPAEGDSSSHEGTAAVLQDLFHLIPTLTRIIMTSYLRASSFTQERLPQIMMCEARIRLANLQIFVYLDNRLLENNALSSLVLGVHPELNNAQLSIPRALKSDVSSLLIEAATDLQGEISNNDFVYVLTGAIPGLSRLGLERKQAFYLKELLHKLIPSLVEARKRGAAEMGIHPAAGLSMMRSGAPEAHLQQGTAKLLDMIGKLYGMPAILCADIPADDPGSDTELLKHTLSEWVSNQDDGDISLKMESLRICINVSEALPDLAASLRFTTQLLQTARRTITLSSKSVNGTPLMSTEEQGRLINNIKRTVNAAPKIGLAGLRADYWDDFLVRGIRLLDGDAATKLIPHTSQDLALAVAEQPAGAKDPFIYNPFSKTKTAADTISVLVAGEMAHFAVSLQNPFEFDVEIEHISLLTEGCTFESQPHNVVLAHFCTQDFILSGTPQTSGALKVVGCRIRVRDCHERSFHVFSKDWQQPKTAKLKRTSSRFRAPAESSLLREGASQPKDSNGTNGFLQSDVLLVTVIQPQPDVSVAGTTLTQPSLMLLEGERKSFEITLQNDSKTAPADLLLFTFEDSVTMQLQTALENRELGPVELHEVQHQLSTNPSIRWKNAAEDEERYIPARSRRKFTFEAFGKPGLTSAVVHVTYAHLATPVSEVKEKFYTRQISFVLALTVNGSVDMPRFNISPLNDNFSWVQERTELSNGEATQENEGNVLREVAQPAGSQLNSQLSDLKLRGQRKALCLCVVDFRNVWPHPISIEVVTDQDALNQAQEAPSVMQHITSEILQPGHISRVLLVMPRIFIPDPFAPVPTIGGQRQFVVSASKMSMEAEASAREAFWYREELLKHVTGTWKELDTGRTGAIDFRKAVRLSARMIDTFKVDHVEIDFLIRPFPGASSNGAMHDELCVKRVSKSHFIIHTEIFATLVVRVRNRTTEQLRLLLRLQPSLHNQPHSIALDLSKRFAWSGVLQRALRPALEPGEVREAELGITALVEGDFEVCATVEEIQGRRPPTTKGVSVGNASTERRIWHAREPCLIAAVEADKADD